LFDPSVFYSKFSFFEKNSLVLYSDPRFCNLLQPISFSQCVGKKFLIIGDTNVGKTEITSQLLTYLRSLPKIKKIYVFELGPERFQIKDSSVGGKLSDYNSSYKDDPHVIQYSYSIIPPRSASKNVNEVYKNCLENYQLIHDDFISVITTLLNTSNEDSALIINDFSIFLHLGSHIPILKLLKTSHTVLVNAYYGQKLAEDYGSNISWREGMIVRSLIRHFDYSIHLIK